MWPRRRRRKESRARAVQAEEILANAQHEAERTNGQNEALEQLMAASAPKLRHNQIAEIIRAGLQAGEGR